MRATCLRPRAAGGKFGAAKGTTMNIEAPLVRPARANRLGLVDCDIHPRTKTLDVLKPYISQRWWDYLQTYGQRRRHGFVKGHPYPKSQPGDGSRRDAWPPNGGHPGSNLAFMREQHLDRYGIEYGIMNPLSPTGQGEQNAQVSAAIAAASNMWQLDAWVSQEPR